MARKQGSKGKPLSRKIQRWLGLVFLASGIFLFAALVTYDAPAYQRAVKSGHVHFPAAKDLAEVALATGPAHGWFAGAWPNAAGALGVFFAVSVLIAFGWVAGWGVPLFLVTWGWNRLALQPMRKITLRTLATLPLAVTLAAIAEAMTPHHGWGGNLGEGIWTGVQSSIGALGGSLLLAVAGIGFFFLEAETWDGRRGVWTRNVIHHFVALGRYLTLHVLALLRLVLRLTLRAVHEGARALWSLARWMSRRPWEHGANVDGTVNERAAVQEKPAQEEKAAKAGKPAKPEPEEWIPPKIARPEPALAIPPKPPAPLPPRTPVADAVVVEGLAHANAHNAEPVRMEHAALRDILQEEPAIGHQDVEAAVMEARRHAVAGKKTLSSKRGKMTLPGVDLLDDVPEAASPVPEGELEDNSKLLTQTLLDFGVSGRVGEVHPGPVITRYEYIPGPGVRVAQILNRQDDLALKLRASRIRILAPIPGKAAVGIEVPNRAPAPIFLRRLLETRAFQEAGGPLPLALGKDIGGMPVTTELSRMPHLLIAGTTGSGKSVCLNALITSLLLKRTPNELRLLMIDPKMLELPMYNGVPHLLTNVVTDAKASVRSFKWALGEMERRYRVLAARGCRNLASYNDKFDREGPKEEGEEKLPYIVIIIDELADLMITSGREVEEPIARLAQTARAVGLHLIVATQRPSVDVITGVIKANFPARIAFQVASRTDSRTILDQNGAESLLGKGDMLFLPPGQASPLRVHGAFVSEEETQRLAEAWREQGEPEACAGLEEVLGEPEIGAGGLGDDPLFEDAARLVVAAGQASASLLQRRLKVGYARAARLVDMMEAAGVVAPQEGSKPREILVDQVHLEHVLAGDPR
jgi:DNA segregation ATPase FtsK/SpoIIIE-like protein